MLSISDKTLVGFIIVFVSGVLWPNSPPFALVCAVTCVFILVTYYRLSAFISGCLLGFLWTSASIHYYLYWQIDVKKFNQNVILVGQVASIVHPPLSTQAAKLNDINNTTALLASSTKFNLEVQRIGKDEMALRPKVRVSWHQPSFDLSQGQTVRLFVRLKAPIGLANPDGFNYQEWLASQNIAATAYVKSSPSNRLIVDSSSLRQTYINRLLRSNTEYLPWLLALTYGDRSLLSDKDWDLMQNTGTAHLFAISGMHLGIVFAFVFLFAKTLLYVALKVTNRQFNLLKLLLLSAAAVCIFYAYIAGMQVPVMRALIASLLAVGLICCGLNWRPSSLFLCLLCIFFILYPFAHLGVSFWFSFSAVFFIVFFVWRFPINNKVKLRQASKVRTKVCYALGLQVFLCIVTMPVVMSVFSIVPFSSLIANVLMIPIVTFILVPLCLINAVFIAFSIHAEWLGYFINQIFEWSIMALTFISALGSVQIPSFILSASQLVVAYVFVLLLLLPASQYRYKLALCIGCIMLCLMRFYPDGYFKSRNQRSHWEINAFDVGQGTAIVIRQFNEKRTRTIIYDTGASFAGGFSMAKAVLMPYFRRHRVTDIDYLMISHFDNDHAGGMSLLKHNLNIGSLITPRKGCRVNEPMQWDAIKIEFLWPLSPQLGDKNNHSCVVKLSTPEVSVLLAGDIEKQAERKLLRQYGDTNVLKADILVAPHHGSKTSSTQAFVDAVKPSHVVFTAGFNNRWGFPAQSVKARYREINSEMYTTGEHGRIQLTIDNNTILSSRYRIDEYPRWYFLALAPKTR